MVDMFSGMVRIFFLFTLVIRLDIFRFAATNYKTANDHYEFKLKNCILKTALTDTTKYQELKLFTNLYYKNLIKLSKDLNLGMTDCSYSPQTVKIWQIKQL